MMFYPTFLILVYLSCVEQIQPYAFQYPANDQISSVLVCLAQITLHCSPFLLDYTIQKVENKNKTKNNIKSV